MQGIKRIHYNSIGIVFHWEHDLINNNTDSYQVIIKNVGFYLLKNELKTFVDCIEETKSNPCNHCMKQTNCGTFLLRTAVEKVDVAVSKTELFLIEDLIKGALFQIELKEYLNTICKN